LFKITAVIAITFGLALRAVTLLGVGRHRGGMPDGFNRLEYVLIFAASLAGEVRF
jgi:hypothetical protein